MNEILVSICCITYNHEQYIRDTLKGFIEQETNFKFEIVISNDCSTDQTQNVIDEFKKKYPNLIRDISPNQNLGSIANFYYALNQCKGKYIAYCEGDDYWIDKIKLQKQVNFLESNNDYGLCYSKSKKYLQEKNKLLTVDFGTNCCTYKDLFYADRIPTQTILFKSSVYKSYYDEVQPQYKEWKMGDLPLLLYFSIKSKIYFFNEVTSVYRVLQKSANHQVDFNKGKEFIDSSRNVKVYFLKNYNLNYNLDELNNRYYYNLFTKAFLVGDYSAFTNYFQLFRQQKVHVKLKTLLFNLFRIKPFFYLGRKIYLYKHG